MERARFDSEDTQQAPVAEGAAGVLRADVSQGVSSTSAARTRTLGGETVEFRAVDYQPPQGSTAPGAGMPAAAPVHTARLGEAQGVASLKGTARPAQEGGLTRWAKVGIAVVLAVVAVLVFIGGYFLIKGALTSMDQNASSAASATYATDAYTLLAVTGEDGSLHTAYLGYVDSINGRTELCLLEPATNSGVDQGAGEPQSLAQVFARDGLAGLAEVVAALAETDVATALVLDTGELEAVFALARGESPASDVSALAMSLWDEGQLISQGALRGLLTAMHQIGPDAFLVMEAPVEAGQGEGDGALQELSRQTWLALVRGMRDPSSDVSFAF